MIVETRSKASLGRPAPVYTHRHGSGRWLRWGITKPSYAIGKPSKLTPRYQRLPEEGPKLAADVEETPSFKEDAAAAFAKLAAQWQEETKATSAIEEVAMHPAYQRIVGMGPAAIPHIMRALERRSDNWFWALRAITGADPVTPEQRGRMSEMAKAWIAWARANQIEW